MARASRKVPSDGRIMYVIGLTGNIAVGKSSVSRILGGLGAHVLDCDVVSHYLMEPGTEVWHSIVAGFGEEILRFGGHIDRRKLGGIVFANPEALRQLEEIAHPAVTQETERLLELIDVRHRAWTASVEGTLTMDLADEPVVVLEAVKLLESGMVQRCDSLWVVTCTREQQLRRLLTIRGLSLREANLRIDAQSPAAEKIRLAHVVIENESTMAHLVEMVRGEWRRMRPGSLG